MSENATVLVRSAGLVVRNRILATGAAVLAAVAVWVVEVPVLGLTLATQFGNAAPMTVGLSAVIVSSLVGALAGWGFLALLEWRTSRPMTLWTGIAIVVLIASLAMPLAFGATMTAKLALPLMHLAVGSVLITGFRRN